MKTNLYQQITNQIIRALEEGTRPRLGQGSGSATVSPTRRARPCATTSTVRGPCAW